MEVHTRSTQNGSTNIFRADAVIVSAPLGVLKANVISFNPSLPEWKTQAIHNLGFGLLNKVRVHLCASHSTTLQDIPSWGRTILDVPGGYSWFPRNSSSFIWCLFLLCKLFSLVLVLPWEYWPHITFAALGISLTILLQQRMSFFCFCPTHYLILVFKCLFDY